jgi:hypothetical protein
MAFYSGPQVVFTAAAPVAANLLVKMNGAGAVLVNTATPADLPVGVTYTASDALLNVPVCGIGYGIMSIMAAAVVININDLLYAGAGGTVTNVAGGRLIGVAKTAAPAGSIVIDVIPIACILTAAALTASTAVSIFLSAGSTFSLGSVASRTLYLVDTTFTTAGCPVQCLNLNFQAIALAIQNLATDVNDLRAKLVTTKVLQ